LVTRDSAICLMLYLEPFTPFLHELNMIMSAITNNFQ